MALLLSLETNYLIRLYLGIILLALNILMQRLLYQVLVKKDIL